MEARLGLPVLRICPQGPLSVVAGIDVQTDARTAGPLWATQLSPPVLGGASGLCSLARPGYTLACVTPKTTSIQVHAIITAPGNDWVTVSPGDGRTIPSFRDREHTSTVSGLFDFSRPAEVPAVRTPEALPPRRAERLQERPATSIPTE